MRVTPTVLPDVLLIEPLVFRDERGAFRETWHAEAYSQVTPLPFVQDNVSVSRHGVVRGLHYQHPHGQGKLVTVLAGAAFDVAVDVRLGSPTFGHWVGEELTEENGRQLWVPAGFAHGFQSLAEGTILSYKCTDVYHPECERTVLWSDPLIGIEWWGGGTIVAPKDASAPKLAGIPAEHLPAFA